MFLIRVVRVAKVIEERDGFDDPLDSLDAEGRNSWRHGRDPVGEMPTQLIVQRADARSLRVHDDRCRDWCGQGARAAVATRAGFEKTLI